jgi:hypothetical protein
VPSTWGKLDSGAPYVVYMVMEYLEGGDLSSTLQKLGRLDLLAGAFLRDDPRVK